jgi:HD-like signal output (HDOD) protein
MWFLDLLARVFRGPPQPRIVVDSAAGQPPSPPREEPQDLEDPADADEPEEPGWWVPRGEPTRAAPRSAGAGDLVDTQLREHLERVLHHSEVELPALPAVAQRALGMLQDENVDFGRLSKVIQDDPAIAAKLLRVVNSTAYSRMFKTDRLELAFARLGCHTVRSIILAMTLKTVTMKEAGAERALGEQLWQQSIVSAALLGEMSRRYGLPDEEAFLVGLLHDIGKLGLLRVLHGYQRNYDAKVPWAEFDYLCDQWHEPLGKRLATHWRLPAPLPAIIGEHHPQPGEDDPLLCYRCLVQLTDVACAMMGYSVYVPYDFFNLPCVQSLGIEDAPETHRWLVTFPAIILERTGVF